jgi:hypothetical protein
VGSRSQEQRAGREAGVTEHTTCRLPLWLKEELVALAAVEHRTVSAQLVKLLEEAMAAREARVLADRAAEAARGTAGKLGMSFVSRDMLPGAGEEGLVVGQPVMGADGRVSHYAFDMSVAPSSAHETSGVVPAGLERPSVDMSTTSPDLCAKATRHQTGVFCKTCGNTP